MGEKTKTAASDGGILLGDAVDKKATGAGDDHELLEVAGAVSKSRGRGATAGAGAADRGLTIVITGASRCVGTVGK
jgi:hypothetical protein